MSSGDIQESVPEVDSTIPKTLPNGPLKDVQYPLKVIYCGGNLNLHFFKYLLIGFFS